MRVFLISIFWLCFCVVVYAQNGVNKEKYKLNAKKATESIQIDGLLDEATWQNAEITSQFLNKWPTDQGLPPLQTEVKVSYDDNFLYVGVTCFEDSPNYVVQTLKRDKSIWDSDGFMLILDPVNQQSNGFIFYTNAIGVKTEGLLTAESDNAIKRDWDNKWHVKTNNKINGDWTAEFAIPFKTLRYDPDLKEWGINFLRCDVGNNMYSTWAFVPLQFNGVDLGYTGTLQFDQTPSNTKSNVSLIPYITGGTTLDNEEENPSTNFSGNVGLDAKVGVTNSLNLDLTVNPDFSQVEVDVQQTNLTRFNLFFPERRTFFLENSDVFNRFGLPPVRPFFSRRIGLDEDGNSVPIYFGARLSGNVNESTRIGLMSMQTGSTDILAPQNYSVAAFNKRVLGRSSFNGMIINRQGFSEGKIDNNDYGRNVSGEFRYNKPNGNLSAWLGLHGSFSPDKFDDNAMVSTGFEYKNRRFSFLQSFLDLGENFLTDVGFNRRLDNFDAGRDTTVRIGYTHSFNNIEYKIFPKGEDRKINWHNLSLEAFNVFSRGTGFSLSNTEFSWNINFMNTSRFRIKGEFTREELPFQTNLLGSEFEFLPAGWYNYGTTEVSYRSNSRKLFSYRVGAEFGQFYNGTITKFEGSLNYRRQPWGNFSIDFERNLVKLPDDFGTADLLLIGPRIEINFSKSIFWTTFLQYNTQGDNFNLNSRFQWRYAPMSDLFLVFTDNYAVDVFGLKNRALVLKFNYWLTL